MREVFTPATRALSACESMNYPIVQWLSGARRGFRVYSVSYRHRYKIRYDKLRLTHG